MNSGKSREENLDPDFESRISISRLALSVLLTLTSIWTAVFLVSNDFAAAATFGCIVFGQPFADLDYLFLPIMTLAFLAFSWKYEPKFLLFLPHCP